MASGPLALQPHCCIVGTPRCDARSNVVYGWVAQLAEQWTENPRVGGSIPHPATPLFQRENTRETHVFPGMRLNPENERKYRFTESKVSCFVMHRGRAKTPQWPPRRV